MLLCGSKITFTGRISFSRLANFYVSVHLYFKARVSQMKEGLSLSGTIRIRKKLRSKYLFVLLTTGGHIEVSLQIIPFHVSTRIGD